MFSFEGWRGEFEQREHPIPSDGHDQERHSGAQVGAGWMVIMMTVMVMTMMMTMTMVMTMAMTKKLNRTTEKTKQDHTNN